MSYGDWQPVIGLEIHAQLLTSSKLFSSESASFGGGDNEFVSEVSLGLPGSLPVLNARAVEFAVKIGLALGCKIRNRSEFARKNYFYPDLPKGYQISQYDLPICYEGALDVILPEGPKRVRIERAHLEEDAGKSIHEGSYTLLNFNRAGVPLLEIVSAPDISSPAEAAEYARTMRNILVYLEACDGNLQEGSLRCDCNVSIRKKSDKKLGTKVEIKNLNSFRFIEKAVEYEIQRQITAIEDGEKIIQETRLYDPTKNKTFSMRTKEEAQDYRYFPDPDLPPVIVEEKLIKEIQKSLPELPNQKAQRFQQEFGLPEYDSNILVQEKALAQYFEAVAKLCKNPKAASNWIMGEVLRELKDSDEGMKACPISPENLAELLLMVDGGTLSGKLGKTVFQEMWKSGQSAKKIVSEKNLQQITDRPKLQAIVQKVVDDNPDQVAQYRAGKDKVLGFFIGQIMRQTKGQASPELVNEVLLELLKAK